MKFRVLAVLLAGVLAGASTSCGRAADLTKLELTDVFTGWYDFGVVGGLNKVVPSFSFRLKNNDDVPVDSVQLTVSFWVVGDDGEKDSAEVRGIGREAVAPSAASEPILVRGSVGYTTEEARSAIFTNSYFKDWVVKVFAKRGGTPVRIGEVKIERRIIPQSGSGRP